METLARTVRLYDADIVVLDAADVPVMLVEVKARQEEKVTDQEELVQYLQAAPAIPYAMLVTLRDIQIFAWDSQALSLLLTAPTADALSFYEPEFGRKTIYEYYLTTLVESWLRDVAFHWKSETPPLFDQLAQLGLTHKLHNGMTHSERAF